MQFAVAASAAAGIRGGFSLRFDRRSFKGYRAKTPHVATLCRYRREPNGETVYQYYTIPRPAGQ